MDVCLRKCPFPYNAMLAICSDLDETPNKEIYFETARYLNTTEKTLLGKGVGLEVGNTIYFDMPEHNFSYTNTDDSGRDKVHRLINSGHIDCLHSFGDFVNSRSRIEQCWSEIQKNTRKIEVWIDHAQAPTNFDVDIMKGEGAIRNTDAFHSDITIQTGSIPFVWKGRVTSIAAQNVTRSYGCIFNKNEIVKSSKTIFVEVLKGWLACLGNKKYAMHKDNKVLRKTQLVDGSNVWEFMRCNPSWGGVSVFDSARGVDQVLTKSVLDTLVKSNGCSVLYSHLGKVFSENNPFEDKTRKAFELLAMYQNNEQILTTTTRRLLGYCRTVDELDMSIKTVGKETHIYLSTNNHIDDLQGLTWYVEDPEKVRLYINEQLFDDMIINPPDDNHKLTISIPWTKLPFPSLKDK